jgi:hypothetical protein
VNPITPGGTSKSRFWLIIPLSLFTLLRLPALLHQAGGQDEQYFAVPGWTVFQEGVPRIPYYPARTRDSFFENADRCVMALPPAMHYVQAPFFALFPPGYPTARLPSFLGALAVIVLTYGLAKRAGAGTLEAFSVAVLLSLSRPLLFTGLSARPDLGCAFFELLAVFTLFRCQDWDRASVPIMVGGACGLAALFHPAALVCSLQVAAALFLRRGNFWTRCKRIVILGLSSIAVFSLWLPLILRYPDEFFSQFFSNVLERSGPGLLSRLVWPFAFIKHQFGNLWECTGPWQFCLLAIMLLVTTILGSMKPNRRWDLIALSWSSLYLTATVAGIHPTLGYWLYPTVIIFVCFGVVLTKYQPSRFQLAVYALLASVLIVPGAGLRASWLYLRHFGDSEYHAPKFIARVLSDLPKEGVFVADKSFVFDIYLSGRQTILHGATQDYGGVYNDKVDYILLGSEGMEFGVPAKYQATRLRLEGDSSAVAKCYVYIFRR